MRVVVTGKREIVSVMIDPAAVDPDDVEMLQDLVLAAMKEALDTSRDMEASRRWPRSPAVCACRGCRPGTPRDRMASPLIEPIARLIEAFARLPGIGPKTAQRLTYHLLRAPDAEARTLAAALVAVREEVVLCDDCFNFSDTTACPICRDPGRDAARLCVVEEPLDVLAIERTGEWRGRYHVLHGAISPMDGIGPERLRIRELLARVVAAEQAGEPIVEVILATNPSLEGDATATYLAERLAGHVGSITRIARGLPVGGDLEYADEITLIRALQGRRSMEEVR